MRYLPTTPAEQRAMLDTIGARSIGDLLAGVPEKARLARPLALAPALAESDLIGQLRALAGRNADADTYACFLGAGAYDHHIPSPVDHLISRGEFFTAYTPYQPEASQGTLRSIFEYQTMIAELSGMDVANASIYDGASSLAEAALMAHAATSRPEIALAGGVHPLTAGSWPRTARGLGSACATCPPPRVVDLDAARALVGDQTAALVIQSPNFYGCLEDVRTAAEIAHAAGALLVVSADPVNLGVLEAPGRLGADIYVGEGQGLGVPLSYGGPHLGVFAAKQELVRRMPAAWWGPRSTWTGPRLRADPPDARAAHPPRQGHVEHLHQRRPVRPHGDDLPVAAGQARTGEGRRAVFRQSPLRGGAPARGFPASPSVSRAVLQGIHPGVAEVSGAPGRAPGGTASWPACR